MTRAGPLALALVASLAAPEALAFCRTTTCGSSNAASPCESDDAGCSSTGEPLAWRSSCTTIGVQKLGSPLRGFDYDDVAEVVQRAFSVWLEADCGGSPYGPALRVEGPSCNV